MQLLQSSITDSLYRATKIQWFSKKQEQDLKCLYSIKVKVGKLPKGQQPMLIIKNFWNLEILLPIQSWLWVPKETSGYDDLYVNFSIYSNYDRRFIFKVLIACSQLGVHNSQTIVRENRNLEGFCLKLSLVEYNLVQISTSSRGETPSTAIE